MPSSPDPLTSLQVRKALENLKSKDKERSEDGKRNLPTPLPGFMMGDVKTDFELTFGETLNYNELGYKKLREVLQNECNDFVQLLKPPSDQYIAEVSCLLSLAIPEILFSQSHPTWQHFHRYIIMQFKSLASNHVHTDKWVSFGFYQIWTRSLAHICSADGAIPRIFSCGVCYRSKNSVSHQPDVGQRNKLEGCHSRGESCGKAQAAVWKEWQA